MELLRDGVHRHSFLLDEQSLARGGDPSLLNLDDATIELEDRRVEPKKRITERDLELGLGSESRTVKLVV